MTGAPGPGPQPGPRDSRIPPGTSVIPPDWFVARFNANSSGPYRSALDPVVMGSWAFAVSEPPQPLVIVAGI